jgi:hypothetical protein
MPASTYTVRVKGLRELQRDFKRMGGALNPEVDKALKRAADIVREQTREIASGKAFNPRTVSGYRSRVRGFGHAYVEQSRSRTTGMRGDWGSIQMQRAMLPALGMRREDVVHEIDLMLAQLGGQFGFGEAAIAAS